jgi:cysteine-rich repeat protein
MATLLGLSLVACAGQIEGGPGDIPENCGNGVIDVGETCDDSNNIDGDGCSATCSMEAVPRVQLSIDNVSVTTDLEVESTIMVTATGMTGFAGDVALTVLATDSADVAITGWTTTLTTSTLSLPLDGTQTTELKLLIPGNHATLGGKLKVTATSTAALAESTIAITANPVVAVTFTDNGAGLCQYPPNRGVNNPFRVTAGRQMMVYNGSPNGTMTIHVSGGSGWDHQDTAQAQSMGQAYGGTVTTVGAQVDFYCHSGGTGTLNQGNAEPFVRVE